MHRLQENAVYPTFDDCYSVANGLAGKNNEILCGSREIATRNFRRSMDTTLHHPDTHTRAHRAVKSVKDRTPTPLQPPKFQCWGP